MTEHERNRQLERVAKGVAREREVSARSSHRLAALVQSVNGRGLSLGDIAEAGGLSKTTVHRLAHVELDAREG